MFRIPPPPPKKNKNIGLKREPIMITWNTAGLALNIHAHTKHSRLVDIPMY